MSYFSSSEYVDSEGKPRWDAFGKFAGELRQFAEDIKILGSISNSDDVNNAERVLLGDYSDDEKTAAGDYLENRHELVDSKLNGIDYSTVIEQITLLLESMRSLESFGLRDADIKALDKQYAKAANSLRIEAEAEASRKKEAELAARQAEEHAKCVEYRAKEAAEREKRERERDKKLDESFRIASILIEKAFGDVDVTRISHRDDFIENNGTSRSPYFPIWMFNDGAARCYCVGIQHGSRNHSHKWFYSVMRSCSVLPSSSYNRYSKGITSGGNYEIKALSHDFDKVVPVVMKHGRVVMDDDVASVCSDDREIKCPRSFVDVDTSSIDSAAIDIDDLEECLDDDIVDDAYNKY